MALLNITLNQEDILQLLSPDHDDAFRTFLQNSLHAVLKAESQEQLKANPYERSEERTDSRNGFHHRPIEGNHPFLTIDATYFKVRENHRVISKAMMIAYGTNEEGHREILGFGAYPLQKGRTYVSS